MDSLSLGSIVTNADPYQEFLRFLFNYRLILGIVFVVAAINGIATFLSSIRAINTSFKSVLTFVHKHFYTRKQLKKDIDQLCDELNTFLQRKALEQPVVNTATSEGFAELIGQQLKHSNIIGVQFLDAYKHSIVDICRRMDKYKVDHAKIDLALKEPSISNILELVKELPDMSSKVKSN